MDLVNLVRSYIARSAPIDMAEKLQFFTLDTLTDIAFGGPFGFITNDKDMYDYSATSAAFYPLMELGTVSRLVHSLLNSRVMQYLVGPKAGDKTGLGAIITIAAQRAAERFANPSIKKQDMLNSFIAHGLTQLECESESTVLILAGSDSTATTMRATLINLLTNPPVYAKLLSEITAGIEAGKISSPVITNAEANTLPYLQAVIREGLRIQSPLNGIANRELPPEGLKINGTFVPGGTEVALQEHSMMTNPRYFGPTSYQFIPERWLTPEEGGFSDAESIKRMDKVLELSFSSGRSSCLGKGIALMELNKLFVELLRRFDLSLVNAKRPIEVSYCSQLFIERGMWVRAVEREVK
jgi:cytochrome P450